MSEAVRKTFADALSLPPRERLELATELLDSVEGLTDPNWEAAWKPELDKRLEAADARAQRGAARFPYVVFSAEHGETVDVVAVAHGRRKPGYWQHRSERS